MPCHADIAACRYARHAIMLLAAMPLRALRCHAAVAMLAPAATIRHAAADASAIDTLRYYYMPLRLFR